MDYLFQTAYQVIDVLLPFDWLAWTFMKRALLAVFLITPMCAAMGVQVVNFGMAFYSDAISHSAFTGVALGILLALDPMVTMIAFGILVGIGITRVREKSSLSSDTIIGVFFSFVVALGIVIISARKGLTKNLESVLYGDILTITDTEILWMALLASAVTVFMVFGYNRLLFLGINRHLAQSRGVRVVYYDYTFAILLALVVTVSIRAVGLLLVTALLVIPAATARNLAKNASQMFWYATSLSLVSGIAGLYLSYRWDSAAGATIILFGSGLFILSLFVKIFMERLSPSISSSPSPR
jgi:zinc transport system permease protein